MLHNVEIEVVQHLADVAQCSKMGYATAARCCNSTMLASATSDRCCNSIKLRMCNIHQMLQLQNINVAQHLADVALCCNRGYATSTNVALI